MTTRNQLLTTALHTTAVVVSALASFGDVAAKEPMKHAIFYGITEAELADPRLLEQGIADVASRGFDGVYFEYRNLRSAQGAPARSSATP